MLRRSNIFYSFWNSVGSFSSSTLPLLIQKYSSRGFFYILVRFPPQRNTALSFSFENKLVHLSTGRFFTQRRILESGAGSVRLPRRDPGTRSAYPGHVIRNSRLGSGEICRGSQLECLFNFRASRVTEERERTHSYRPDRVCWD